MTGRCRAATLGRAALAALALAVATLAVLWPLGLTGRVLAGIDAYTYFTPYWSYRMAALQAGHLPLWNPYLFLGVPFLANPQAAVLYPLHWPLSWLSSAGQALAWSAVLHVWLASCAAYLFGRRSLGLTRIASALTGLLFGLGGYTLARVENINQLNALAWFPAMLWLYDETAGAAGWPGRIRGLADLAAVIALALLAGHTQTAYLDLAGLALYAAVPALGGWRMGRHAWLRQAGARLWPLLAIFWAVLLAAAQLWPSVELNGLGLRTGGLPFRQAVSFSLRPRLLVQSLLPPLGSDLGAAFGSEGYAEFVGYLGTAALVLAICGLAALYRPPRSRRGPDAGPLAGGAAAGPVEHEAASTTRALATRRALTWLALAGLVLALGAYNPLYYLLWRFVPGFALFRAPARWLALFALAASGLAGVGLDALGAGLLGDRTSGALRRLPRRRWLWLLAALAVAALLALQQWPRGLTVAGWLAAGLVAAGLCYVAAVRPATRTVARGALLTLALAELWIGSRALPFTLATAPDVVTGLRIAPATLLAATRGQPPAGRDRFLSLSDIRFDPGDLAELRSLQAGRLPPEAIERYVRAIKQLEVIAPNLSLMLRLPAVDGYDGGLLPLGRYVRLESLFLASGQGGGAAAADSTAAAPALLDGRLREFLRQVPDGRLLDLTGTRYVITDKQNDLWAGDVYYDLEQAARLQPGETLRLDLAGYSVFSATALGIVSHIDAAGQAPGPVARIELVNAEGHRLALELATPADTAWSGEPPATGGHTVARRWPDWMGAGQDYLSVKGFPSGAGCELTPPESGIPCAFTPTAVEITALPRPAGGAGPSLVLRGLSLVDRRTGAHTSITISPRGDFRRIQSGDVKIYEREAAPGRAWLVHDVQVVAGDDAALARLADPGFDPRATAIVTAPAAGLTAGLSGGDGSAATSPANGDRVSIAAYEAERVVLQTESTGPALLVLADAAYPGWSAVVDGQPVPVLTTNLMFRGVALPAGRHEVVFAYHPTRWTQGLAATLAALAVLLIALATPAPVARLLRLRPTV